MLKLWLGDTIGYQCADRQIDCSGSRIFGRGVQVQVDYCNAIACAVTLCQARVAEAL